MTRIRPPETTAAVLSCEERHVVKIGDHLSTIDRLVTGMATSCGGAWTPHRYSRSDVVIDTSLKAISQRTIVDVFVCSVCGHERTWGNRGFRLEEIDRQQEPTLPFVVAFPGGAGTADMVRRARAAGVEVLAVAAEVRT
jgi:hypothetical protein